MNKEYEDEHEQIEATLTLSDIPHEVHPPGLRGHVNQSWKAIVCPGTLTSTVAISGPIVPSIDGEGPKG